MKIGRPGLIALMALLGIAALTGGCAPKVPSSAKPTPAAESKPATAPPASTLRSVEITSFQGKPLDAVSAEPETSIKGPQNIAIGDYRLAVGGMVKRPLSLTYEQVLALPPYQKVTTLRCVDGWSVTYLWQGVLLSDLLKRAGYDPKAKIVIFRCYDGYSTSLPLDYVMKKNILLAYKMNGMVMPPERGFPFQVVAEDRYGYKWAKWVTGIELSDNTRFRGHFEQMGADNTATVPAAK
jgi:DMSO/TMAO reductase YedYZ molybdopterin-dependent catalytic subunit